MWKICVSMAPALALLVSIPAWAQPVHVCKIDGTETIPGSWVNVSSGGSARIVGNVASPPGDESNEVTVDFKLPGDLSEGETIQVYYEFQVYGRNSVNDPWTLDSTPFSEMISQLNVNSSSGGCGLDVDCEDGQHPCSTVPCYKEAECTTGPFAGTCISVSSWCGHPWGDNDVCQCRVGMPYCTTTDSWTQGLPQVPCSSIWNWLTLKCDAIVWSSRTS